MERFRKSIGELDLNYNMERGVTHIIETIKFTENFSYLFKEWVNYLQNSEITKVSIKKDLKLLFNEYRDAFLLLIIRLR